MVAIFLVTLAPTPAAAATAEVHIVGGAPDPAQVFVDDGDTVTFLNDDDVAHTIYAAGQPRGNPIPPHTGAEFGPFQTGGQRGTFAYQVDQNGPAGTIIVRGTATSTSSTTTTLPVISTTRPTTTTTTTAPTTTTTTSTTEQPTTTTTAAGRVTAHKKESSTVLAVLGFVLLVAGIGGLVVVVTRSRRGHPPG